MAVGRTSAIFEGRREEEKERERRAVRRRLLKREVKKKERGKVLDLYINKGKPQREKGSVTSCCLDVAVKE